MKNVGTKQTDNQYLKRILRFTSFSHLVVRNFFLISTNKTIALI